MNVRVNYTGHWVQGEREGNGTTSFRDGAVYTGEYRWVTDTVNLHMSSSIPGLDWSMDEASSVIPMGTALTRSLWLGRSWDTESSSESKLFLVKFELDQFRYASGDQREGFFRDNILDGQVHEMAINVSNIFIFR